MITTHCGSTPLRGCGSVLGIMTVSASAHRSRRPGSRPWRGCRSWRRARAASAPGWTAPAARRPLPDASPAPATRIWLEEGLGGKKGSGMRRLRVHILSCLACHICRGMGTADQDNGCAATSSIFKPQLDLCAGSVCTQSGCSTYAARKASVSTSQGVR